MAHEVVVTEVGGGLAQEIRAARHVLRSDEPVASGGTDTGPDPYGLLLAALGSCTSMTLRLYARRKSWPLDGISVALSHERIHEKDCESCEKPDARISRITREITIAGALSPEQRARLLEIAERCPVHRTLEGEIRIITALAET
jgi:uncharacterized OsmC-like protein